MSARKFFRPRAPCFVSATSVILATLFILIVIAIVAHTPLTSIPTVLSTLPQGAQTQRQEARDSLYHAWEQSNETCDDWIRVQRQNNAYLDAYVVGSQKAGTTQLTRMLEGLHVRRENMIKEWHFFNHLTSSGVVQFGRLDTEPLPPLDDLERLRLMHYHLGFPTLADNVSSLPPIDHGPVEDRTIVLDSTVEYLHMERAAILAKQLTPHSRIIIMMRDPPKRALSQYNMLRRNINGKLRAQGEADRPATSEEFDQKVRDEITVLRECGYNDATASLQDGVNTTGLIRCLRFRRPKVDDAMYVLRGLYALFIPAWRQQFPDSRILVVAFSDLARGDAESYQRIARFLCIKPFTEQILQSVQQDDGSTLSHGARAARDGLTEVGPDSYHGNDRYLPTMLPSTKKLLDEFYRPANMKLEEMVGRPMFE